ncbi:helix-turn-helix domain-containing protein [Sorangium sp. So ce388]|uniref:helix-turn-helix domain-containing protein n=1 Tax=Sorangium sp. So ce388 TaxID=3133309 RepID=UPI003F5B4012
MRNCQSQAAARLGLSRQGLLNKMDRYGLKGGARRTCDGEVKIHSPENSPGVGRRPQKHEPRRAHAGTEGPRARPARNRGQFRPIEIVVSVDQGSLVHPIGATPAAQHARCRSLPARSDHHR